MLNHTDCKNNSKSARLERMKICSITDSITSDGLKLAGLEEAYEAQDEEEAEEIFKKLLDEKEVEIILLSENLAQQIDEKLLETKREEGGILPIVIEIPGKEGPVPERREVIDKLVKRAVGIKLEG